MGSRATSPAGMVISMEAPSAGLLLDLPSVRAGVGANLPAVGAGLGAKSFLKARLLLARQLFLRLGGGGLLARAAG